MARKWSEIRKTLSPEAEERIRGKVKAAAKVMTLYQRCPTRRPAQAQSDQALKNDQGESEVPGNSQETAN